MTGPEHYQRAESLLLSIGDAESWEQGQAAIALAQVHASLALAAATALGREGEGRTQPSKDRAAWFDAASECRKNGAPA